MSTRRFELTPEEALDHALADLTLLAGDIRRLLDRADSTMPGPGAASSSGSARGFNVDDPTYDQPAVEKPAAPAPAAPTAEQLLARGRVGQPATAPTSTTDDEHVPMNRDEARAINGADAAERAVNEVNRAIARIRRDVATINRELAPFRRAGKPFNPNDVPEDWCPNCYRHGRRHTESRKSKGKNHWTEGWCDFCGNFLAARRKEDQEAGRDRDGWLPTRKILAVRFDSHVGRGNVTDHLIASEERKLPKTLKPKGGRRRGRSPLFAKDHP